MKIAFVFLPLLALAAETSLGSWGPAGCAPVGAAGFAPRVVTQPTYHWEWSKGYSNQVHLMHGNARLGTFWFPDGLYYPWDGRQWSLAGDSNPPAGAPPVPGIVGRKKAAAPKAVPCGCSEFCSCESDACDCRGTGRLCHPLCPCTVAEEVLPPRQDFGMEWRAGNGVRYSVNGAQVPLSVFYAAIEKGIPDDVHKWPITVSGGTEPQRKQVVADLEKHPLLAKYREGLKIQEYPPDHWAVREAGFRTDGHPTVYVQAPPGQVLHRQDDYTDGAEGLLAAVRKADPTYAPDKDRDLRKPEPLFPNPLKWLAWIKDAWQWLVIGGAVLLTWMLTPKRTVAP